MYGGADGYYIKATLNHGAKGLVVEGLDWGNVNQPMYAAIKDAIARRVPVVITSRVPMAACSPTMAGREAARPWSMPARYWATTCLHRKRESC